MGAVVEAAEIDEKVVAAAADCTGEKVEAEGRREGGVVRFKYKEHLASSGRQEHGRPLRRETRFTPEGASC